MVLSRAGFETFVSALPGAIVNEQWEASCAKVGGKVFALFGIADRAIRFKVTEIAFEGLTSLDGIEQAAYFAKGSWVKVDRGALPDADLKAYLRESHRIIASKLTRKLKAELGLE